MNPRALMRRFKRAPEIYGGRVLICVYPETPFPHHYFDMGRADEAPPELRELKRLYQKTDEVKDVEVRRDGSLEILVKVFHKTGTYRPYGRSWRTHGFIMKAVARLPGTVRFDRRDAADRHQKATR